MSYRNFLDIKDISKKDAENIIDNAVKYKEMQKKGEAHLELPGAHLATIFEKPSTRTRVSFEVAINQLGGKAIVLSTKDTQISRGESISDTAKLLSSYVDFIMIRTYMHEKLISLAENATIPVINGLTDFSHPCQVMADLLTIYEEFGEIEGKTISWYGDYNNMTTSWIHAAKLLNFNLNLAIPEELIPDCIESDNIKIFKDPIEAAQDADCITTDTWQSMGDENIEKISSLTNFQVTDEIMLEAKKKAIFLHCLPAHRGKEVTASVIDSEQSRIWQEAENRIHAQKSIMLWCAKRF